MLLLALLVVLTCTVMAVLGGEENCKVFYSYGYGYSAFFRLSDAGVAEDGDMKLLFKVKATSDAHILLSPTATPGERDPVYEVVLGAGRNTFSDIRRLRRTATRASKDTPGLLSATEFRGFWISVGVDGLVAAGRNGSDLAFIAWRDTQPLRVRYFSFCTWSGVPAEWHFGCRQPGQPQVSEVPRNWTASERLRKDLLTTYDPFSRPVLDADRMTTVSLELGFQHVDLDEMSSVLSVGGIISLTWKDEKLRWNSSDYGGLRSLAVPHHRAWQPDLVLYNAAGLGTDVLTDTPMMLVTDAGDASWAPRVVLKTWCNLDLSNWPRDRHECEMQLGSWAQQGSVELRPSGNWSWTSVVDNEWDVLTVRTESRRLPSPWENQSDEGRFTEVPREALVVRLTLQRKNQSYSTVLLAPFIASSLMAFLSFWTSPRHSGRMLLVCLAVAILALFLLAVARLLPAPADHVPGIVLLYSRGLGAACSCVLVSVLVTALTRYVLVAPLPTWLCSFLTARTTQIVLQLPPPPAQVGKSYNQLEDDRSPDDSSEIQHCWILLATTIDRLCCVFYSGFMIYISASASHLY